MFLVKIIFSFLFYYSAFTQLKQTSCEIILFSSEIRRNYIFFLLIEKSLNAQHILILFQVYASKCLIVKITLQGSGLVAVVTVWCGGFFFVLPKMFLLNIFRLSCGLVFFTSKDKDGRAAS